jgi:hypothetical protein
MANTVSRMAPAGNYYLRFLWLVPTRTQETTYGTPKYDYSTEGAPVLWGYVVDLSSTKQVLYTALNNRVGCEIRLRGEVALDGKHRLQEKASGVVYMLDGNPMYDRTKNETTISAHRGADVQ